MMWVTFNSTLGCFDVSGCCSHHTRRVWLHWEDGIESQRMWPIHWGPIKSLWFRIYHITLHQRTQAIPGSDLGLIELMLRVFTTNLLPQTLDCSWRLMNLYRCLVPHRAYLTLLCRMKSGIIHWNTRGGGDPRLSSSLRGWDNDQRMWIICVVAPPKHHVR